MHQRSMPIVTLCSLMLVYGLVPLHGSGNLLALAARLADSEEGNIPDAAKPSATPPTRCSAIFSPATPSWIAASRSSSSAKAIPST